MWTDTGYKRCIEPGVELVLFPVARARLLSELELASQNSLVVCLYHTRVTRYQSSSAWPAPGAVAKSGPPPESHAIRGAAVGHNSSAAQMECIEGRDKEQGEAFCVISKGVYS